jgi:hypothetical protein
MALGVALATAAVGGACVTDPNTEGVLIHAPSPQAKERARHEREAAQYRAAPQAAPEWDRSGAGAGGGGGGGGGH